MAVPKKDRPALAAALLAELFGRKYRSGAAAAAAAAHLPLDEQDVWNQTVLPLHGIGEDSFFLNESFERGKSILSFETLRDFDEDDYRFQEDARRRSDPTYAGRPYLGTLYLKWARLFVDGKFTYATLSMAAGHLYAGLDEAAGDILQDLIPHRYVPGKDHGKPEGDCWRWDLDVEAGGKEAILQELEARVRDYVFARWDELATRYDGRGAGEVYFVEPTAPEEEVGLRFVFSDKTALSSVRFRSFMRDCRTIVRPSSGLTAALKTELGLLAEFIAREHGEILRTHDPMVARLRPRRKVLVRKDAFD